MFPLSQKAEIIFQKVFNIFFLSLFLALGLIKIDFFNDIMISYIIKSLYVIFIFLFYILYGIKNNLTWHIVILTISFILGKILLNNFSSLFIKESINGVFKKGELYLFVKYLFIFLFISVFSKLKYKKEIALKALSFFKVFININTILILIGFVFSINCFQTYPYTTRFGYQGIMSINLYVIGLAIFYIDYMNESKKRSLIFTIIGALFFGKKALILMIFLLLLIHLWRLKYNNFLILIGLVTTLFTLSLKYIVAFFIQFSTFWQPLYEKYDLLTLVTSTRDLLMYEAIDYIKVNWSVFNYFFGGGDRLNIWTEFGFFDLWLTFGGVGLLVYMHLIKNHFLTKIDMKYKLVLISIFCIEFFSGSILNDIIQVLLIYFLSISCRKEILISNT